MDGRGETPVRNSKAEPLPEMIDGGKIDFVMRAIGFADTIPKVGIRDRHALRVDAVTSAIAIDSTCHRAYASREFRLAPGLSCSERLQFC